VLVRRFPLKNPRVAPPRHSTRGPHTVYHLSKIPTEELEWLIPDQGTRELVHDMLLLNRWVVIHEGHGDYMEEHRLELDGRDRWVTVTSWYPATLD